MDKRLRSFILDEKKKFIILDRNKKIDAISEYKRIGGAIKTPINFMLLSLLNICPSMKLKRFLLRKIIGIKIGKNVGIAPCTFDCVLPKLINIGDNTIIGWKTHILCHEFTQEVVRVGRVNIGKNVLISNHCKIRSGVSIGDNAQIAMDSFVNRDVPANELWGGIPAKKIKKLR